MDTGVRLIAGSHNINEFVLINADENARIKSVKELVAKAVRYAEMRLRLQWMESPSLPAMNALSLSAEPAMNMREERETKLALNAKPDTNESKLVLGLKVMKKKMT